MGSKKDISVAKKQEIKALINNTSYTIRFIAQLTNVSVGAVHKIKKSLCDNFDQGSNRKGRSGRKRITTSRDERQIEKICLNNRKTPIKLLTREVQSAGINISQRTLERRLKDQGFSCRRPAKKPRLTDAMVKKRLAWAKQFKDWTEEDWEKV